MNVFHEIEGLSRLRGPVSLAIGIFDGLHLGHQAVIRHTLDEANGHGGSAVVVTFAPHPQRILCPGRAPKMLASSKHRIQLLRRFGVQSLLVIPFTREFAATDPREFVLALYSAGRPLHGICVGHEWSFGRGRSGNLPMLSAMGGEFHFGVHGIPPVQLGGRTISSTLVRALVEDGDLAGAEAMLGRPFSLFGEVCPGAQLGRKLGFPTANLSTQNEQLPPCGVYAVRACLDGTGNTLVPGVLNIGYRPTLGGEPPAGPVVELHLLDFQGDLYGREIEVALYSRLRGERKFPSLEMLQEQICRDVAACHAVFSA